MALTMGARTKGLEELGMFMRRRIQEILDAMDKLCYGD